MSSSVILYRNGSQQIFLAGERDGAALVLNKLQVAGVPGAADETFDIVAGQELRVRHEAGPNAPALVEPLAPGSEEFRFIPSQFGLTLTATLAVSAATTTFFGRALNASADFRVSLVIRVPLSGLVEPSNAPVFVTIEGCGRFAIGDSNVEFSTEPLCFQINVDEFPLAFPSTSLPTLDLGLPDFGFSLPKIRLPWSFTRLPSLPLQMPTLSFDFGPLPISVSWKSVKVSQTGGHLIVDVQQLRIEGKVGAIEGDLHVVFLNGQVVFDPARPEHSYFNLYRPDFQHVLRLSFSRWHFDEECALVTWEKGQINEWLRLIAPDLADDNDKESSVALRVLRGGTRLDEIRLDWKTGAQAKTLQLPGFKITFPKPEFYTLLLHNDESEEGKRLTLISTIAPAPPPAPGEEPTAALLAKSTFTLNRLGGGNGDGKGKRERELLQDENPNQELIKFTADPKNPISIALMDLPVDGKSALSFFKQLEKPLRPLFEVEEPEEEPEGLPDPPTECPPTLFKLKPLQSDDWKDVKLKINLPKTFEFPFLKRGGDQAVSITKAGDPQIDFGTQSFTCDLDVTVKIGTLELKTKITLAFNWESFAFSIRDDKGIKFKGPAPESQEFLGLTWRFTPGKDEETGKDDLLFILTTKDKDYQLKQAPGSKLLVEYSKATAEPLTFEMRDFVLSSGGISVKGRVIPSPVTLNAVNTKFSFTEGSFEIQENELRDFSISGSGPLPPKLVGDAIADISLQFGLRKSADGGESFQLISGAAQLRGKNLLKCKGTRFEFSVDGIGLKFVNDGKIHFYFTITGRAKFVPLPSDDSSGPLAWLPGIEMQLLECPLTSDVSVLSKHIKFLVEMPKKATFDFLGCFKMELRGIGFVPQALMFDRDTAAMELSGQIMFADGAGDVIEAKVDFHSIFIGLPRPGQIIPRISVKDIAVKVRSGDAFTLEGAVEYIDGEIEPGLQAKGFAGRGSLTIQGLPTFTAAFTFVRVSRDGGQTWVRAWFLYVQAGKLSLRIPVINVFIREVGLGFGYRYTLASIKAADEIDDPRKLLAELKKLSRTQGELARRDQWRVDLEESGRDPRWTFVARILIAQNSAAAGMTDWNSSTEKELPSIFLLDVVLALRSDLTFLMTGRGWINTNYNDYLEKESLRTSPLLSGFILLSPRRKRFLANLSSNPGAEFGDHPPLPGFLKDAIRQSSFSATLLIEPGLLHYELGWPNMLRWRAKLGPLEAEFRGGMIFRLSRRELVIGNSYMARGSLELSAKAGGSAIGARLSALAQVSYGARYIGVIGFEDPRGRSALYGAVGLEINVRCSIEFWLRIKIGFFKLSINLSFSFSINLTALLEVGITAGDLLGARGTGSVSLSIMGRGLHFKVHVGINEGAVDAAFRITQQYLNIGLEATEVEPVPGSSQRALNAQPSPASPQPSPTQPLLSPPPGGPQPPAPVGVNDSGGPAVSGPANAPQPPPTETASTAGETVLDAEKVFERPQDYSIFTIPLSEEKQNGDAPSEYYFILLPSADTNDSDGKQGFLPVPPKAEDSPAFDFKWIDLPKIGAELQRFEPLEGAEGTWKDTNAGTLATDGWRVKWEHELASGQNVKPEEIKAPTDDSKLVKLRHLVANAFITVSPEDSENEFFDGRPDDDPALPPMAGDALEDTRIHNPSDDAFEAAVRGAAEQFEGSPYFKHDPNSIYEQKLGEAFSPQTTVYSEHGLVEGHGSQSEKTEQAVQMRSVIISQMVTDLQRYVELKRRGLPDESEEVRNLIKASVGFQLGLVFKTTGGTPNWYDADGDGLPLSQLGTITQRSSHEKPDSVHEKIEVKPFNRLVYHFRENAPQFQRVRHFADANTVAITWDLVWRESELVRPFQKDDKDVQKLPEHHLQHYLVRRRALAGGEQEVEFSVKPVDALNMNVVRDRMVISDKTITLVNQQDDLPNFNAFKNGQRVKVSGSTPANNGFKKVVQVSPKQLVFEESFKEAVDDVMTISALQLLKSRFQFVDHFNDETAEDQALLTERGKSYIYTITPVDITGAHSTRPLTILATRLPNEAPQVPADGEMIVKYHLRQDDKEDHFKGEIGQPKPLLPSCLVVQWTEPPDPPGKPHVVIREYSLVFRREAVFPAGSYGHNAESQGSRASGLPTSNARRLRTDIVVPLKVQGTSRIQVFIDPKTKQKRFHYEISVAELIKSQSILFEKEWRPEAWRVFFQTHSEGNISSALTPVQILLQFFAGAEPICEPVAQAQPFEERRPGLLEWIARPVIFRMMPPEDERVDVDFASVPMPQPPANETTLTGLLKLEPLPGEKLSDLEFIEHPDRLRCLRFHWNQGPSRRQTEPVNPVELHAGYQLYEFDLDSHTAGILDNPPDDFLTHLRHAQDMEIMSADDLMLTPANTLVANQWEAWYPSTVRRRWLRQNAPSLVKTDPKFSEATLNPWYSWRDSYLQWPDDESMFVRDGDATIERSTVGMMNINLAAQTVTASTGRGFVGFRPGQSVRVTVVGNPASSHNGLKRISEAADAVTTTVLKFVAGSFKEAAEGALLVVEALTADILIPGNQLVQPIQMATGIMSIDKEAQSVAMTSDGARNFRAGQYVRISGAHNERNNGIKKITEVSDDRHLKFEANSFVESEPIIGDRNFDSDHVAQGTMSIVIKENQLPSITFAKGGLEIFQPGQFIRISRKDEAPRLVQVASQDDVGSTEEVVTRTTLRFKPDSFIKAEQGVELILDNLTLVVDGRPFVGMHPFLARLVEDLGRIQDFSFADLDDADAASFNNKTKDYTVDLNPSPSAEPVILDALIAQTTTLQDPYGWNILKRMGLVVAFTLRDARTGEVVEQMETQQALRLLLKRYKKDGKDEQLDAELSRHLFIEYLFQPAKSSRLKAESKGESPEVKDLLALVQVSLRPAIKQAYRYRMLEISAPSESKVEVKADASCTVIDLAQPTIQTPLEPQGVKEVRIPANGKTTLLFRSVAAITVKLNDNPVSEQNLRPFNPSDWLATYFTSPSGGWPQQLQGVGDVTEQWQRFKRYLLRLNPPNPASPTDPKIEFPTEEDKIPNLMSWLNRFFEAGGDIAQPSTSVETGKTDTGPWLATAYPRTMSPVGVLPDNAGRLTYNHLIEDKWAHVYRYYFLPHGRYDRLWQSLAQSDIIYPPLLTKKPELKIFSKPAKTEGGLDVVLDRIHKIAPPLVLFSGRLDRKASDAALAPPGKTWEVIVAKHPEQLLVERNRTLVRQLDYRHLAHTLLRRYAFLPALSQLDEGLRLLITESPFGPREKVATGENQTAQLVIRKGPEEKRVDLLLNDNNNLEGLMTKINATPDIELKAELLPPVATPESSRYLVLSRKDGAQVPSDNTVSLLAEKDNESSDLLRRRYSVSDKLMYTVGPQDISLPGPYPVPPEQLPLDKLSVDEWLTIDLPTRIGVFGKGAVVLQWEALPFFYEHRLLLVAQTSKTVVSPVSTVVQKDFEYVSPVPAAELEGVSDRDAPERSIFMQLELKNHWACLPSAKGDEETEDSAGPEAKEKPTPVKERWPAEKPGEDEHLVFSSLPDSEVVYQVVLEYESGVTETQAEFFFELKQPEPQVSAEKKAEPVCGYKVRQLGRKFFATPLKVRPPKDGVGEKQFFLDARLEKNNVVALPHPLENRDESLTFKGDLTRAKYNEELLAVFPQLKLLTDKLSTEERARTLRRFVAAAVVSKKPTPLPLPPPPAAPPPSLPEGIEFIEGEKTFIVARRFLNEQEQKIVLAFYPDAPDKGAVERFVKDMENRRVLEQYLQDWVGEQAVGSRRSFSGGGSAQGRLEFPAPMSCALALDIRDLDKDEIETTDKLRAALRKLLEQNTDHSFATAIRSLGSRFDLLTDDDADATKFINAEASVGIEQIGELSDNAELDVVKKEITWRGSVSAEQLDTLSRWVELSDFRETFKAVRRALTEFPFDAAEPFPKPEEIPLAIRGRIKFPEPATMPLAVQIVIEETEPESPVIRWMGLQLTPDEEAALRTMENETSGHGASFRKAIGDLLKVLKGQAEIKIPVKEADWRPRPDSGSLTDALLKKRLLIGNGRLRFYGWMTRAEGEGLLGLARNKPDESAIERLFDDSMSRGMDGGRLIVTARRGSAGIKSAVPVSALRKD